MHIAHVEIANFRKLYSVRIDLTDKTTLFVGANNSGKTSAIQALRRFLVKKGKGFRTQDFTLAHWSAIDEIGKTWEAATEDNPVELDPNLWTPFLPMLDIWLKVENNEIHHVSELLPSLDWAGGLLGVRLCLRPKDLEGLYREFRTAIQDVHKLHQAAKDAEAKGEEGAEKTEMKLTLWPVSLTDFLSRKLSQHLEMQTFLLDPEKLVDPVNGQAKPQVLAEDALSLDTDPLHGLIRVNEINAQRGLGETDGADIDPESTKNHDSQKLSDQLRTYYTKHLDPFQTPDVADLAALQAIEAAQEAFDKRLHASFADAFTEVEGMGYPGVSDPKLKITSKLKTVDGLDHDAAVSFEIQMVSKVGAVVPILRLPESYNGLGYQNLISMIFRLMSFRDAWMRVGKASKIGIESKFEPIHLVLVEEPEAHLHAQVQQVFINKAYKVLRDHDHLGENPALQTQLIVSTHSSHVAHEAKFACLRYFRRLPAGMGSTVPISTVINLSGVFGEGTETERFVTRYLRAHHSDLFFADAAILVEGPAEKILVPNFIREHYDFLTQCYITLLEINGSHAHRLKPLIDELGLLTLVVTDLDAGEVEGEGEKVKAAPVRRGADQRTNNNVLKSWAPMLVGVDDLLAAIPEQKTLEGDQLFAVRVAYQLPISVLKNDGEGKDEALPSTFEDALVFENTEIFSKLEGNGLVKKFRNALNANNDATITADSLFQALRGGNKAEFALDVLLSEEFCKLKCPGYISEGLMWLQERLKEKQVDVLPSIEDGVVAE
ncbi:AAA family ATPase [Thiobacillus denitrificans]|uniref:AAA family ATPase n=1 Tax=Thiobacillus denitrificans TaxID=36861 RepID=UPI00036E56E2|nr:AAA family ATPase [Thiobacillus denitrificans]